mgnify:CR=1 FL=1
MAHRNPGKADGRSHALRRHDNIVGYLFMLPALLFMDFRWGFERLADPVNLFNLLFLGVGASAMCFVTWNMAVKLLGAIKTSAYILSGTCSYCDYLCLLFWMRKSQRLSLRYAVDDDRTAAFR